MNAITARIRGEITAVEAAPGGALITAMPYIVKDGAVGKILALNDNCPIKMFMPTPPWNDDEGTVYFAEEQIGQPVRILFEDDLAVATGRRCENIISGLWPRA